MNFQLTSLAQMAVKKARTYARFSAAAQQCVKVAEFAHDHLLLPVVK